MALLMYKLKDDGRAAIVLPDGFLFGEGVKTTIKEKLLADFKLHTIVRLPKGVFEPYSDINVNLLFLEKGASTNEIWFFEHPLPKDYRQYTKTRPIKLTEFDLEKKWLENKIENEYAWKVSIDDIKIRNYNLDFKNPLKQDDSEATLTPQELIVKFKNSYARVDKILSSLEKELI